MNHSSIDSANKQGFAFAIGAASLFSCKPIIIKWAYNLSSKKHIDRLGSLLFTCIPMTIATLATIIHTDLVLTFDSLDSSNLNGTGLYSTHWEFSNELMAIVCY